MSIKSMRIKAVVLHLDTILIQTDVDEINKIKISSGCPVERSMPDFIRSLPNAAQKNQILAELERRELKAATSSKFAPETEEVLRFLKKKNLRMALVSHSCFASVQTMLEKISFLTFSNFDAIITREDLLATNADINPVTLAVQKLNILSDQILTVAGDLPGVYEAQAAGTIAVFRDQSGVSTSNLIKDVIQISQLDELIPIVRLGIPLPPGKLPNDLLREFLNQFVFKDPSIIINPGVGEDTAAVNVESEEVLVLKSDPITFATDSIGQYAVLINANDIATSGARPRWLLTTLLFPCGVTPSEIRAVIEELKEVCRQWDITLCGGHTEITDAVSRPVVTGMMAGTVAKSNLIDKRNMAAGDRVLLTKAVAVEGTAIIAREFGSRLKSLGMDESEINKCRQFLANISIIEEARIAAGIKATSAMHDVTEGGIATALEELGIAGGHQIKIDLDAIPVYSETRKICQLLNINPLGLIGSGSLLICCREAGCNNLMTALRKGGVDVTCIGEVQDKGQGIIASDQTREIVWPQFEADEITRLF